MEIADCDTVYSSIMRMGGVDDDDEDDKRRLGCGVDWRMRTKTRRQ